MSQHVVIIGAVALGPKAACRFKRLEPDSKVTMIDRDAIVSYGGCGIPYFISGDVSDLRELRTTSFHLVRNENFFHECKDIEVFTRTEALRIDRKAKTVLTRNLDTGVETEIPYDQLVISTGAVPRRLNIPGEDLPGVHAVANLHDAQNIKNLISTGGAGKAVVVGSGFIGLEVAEGLADMWGLDVAVVEIADHVLARNISPTLATMAEQHLREKGVELYFGEKLVALEGDGKVSRVVTDKRSIEADMVVLSAGVIPNSKLAKEAGLDVSPRGGVMVDTSMRTSDPLIFAGGDCVEIPALLTGGSMYLPLGSMANRQGRIIGSNLAGGKAEFPGAVGSFAVKIFERSVAGAGLTPEGAKLAGFDAVSSLVLQLDRAHFYPGRELLAMEITVDKASRKVLGVQGYGAAGDALVGRIGAVAAMMQKGCTVDDICVLEFPYSPPFASAMDIVNTLGTVADNMLAGMNQGLSPQEFSELFAKADPACYFLDCRETDNATPYLAAHPDTWHNIPQGKLREHLDEIPKDKQIVLVCNTGIRAYESQVTLKNAGFKDVLTVHGGMAAMKMGVGDLK